ncbi:nickel-dependent hydrogenase large subunit [Sulfurospirillum sp. 1612]|uniref:nickel-dependent hydrogenase large subunit n=1 Tax=Sulfurospirillum sp. 1612 TaxID=3094835 RepID=UPI002F94F94D
MTTKEIIERVEGEATLELEWDHDKISYAKIKFANYRAIEKILQERHLLDALMVTPRVCGICSHSHVNASILAIEDCYRNLGIDITLTQKAQYLRELILNAEKIQNHIKWFYFLILPELFKMNQKKFVLSEPFRDKEWFEAQQAITNILKMGSLFSGQWPHGSYVMPGGVTCDPINSDVINAKNHLIKVKDFCEERLYGCSIEEFLAIESMQDIINMDSTLEHAVYIMKEKGFHQTGKSYDRFLTLGGYTHCDAALKVFKTRVVKADVKFVEESLENSFFQEKTKGFTYSKSALYKKMFYEVGPLSRLMASKDALIRDCHRRCADSTITRIVARIKEIAILIQRSEMLLDNIDIRQKSLQTPKKLPKNITSHGVGVIEAARGSLIHKVEVENGLIKSYDIIPPTVWNLGNGSPTNPSIAQKAIIGLDSVEAADFIFKSFDICSVCTTQ